MLLHYDEFASPIGRILFASDGEAICALDFEDYRERMKRLLGRRFSRLVLQRHSDPQDLKDRLQAYFEGNVFALEVAPSGRRAAHSRNKSGRRCARYQQGRRGLTANWRTASAAHRQPARWDMRTRSTRWRL